MQLECVHLYSSESVVCEIFYQIASPSMDLIKPKETITCDQLCQTLALFHLLYWGLYPPDVFCAPLYNNYTVL